MKTKKSIFLLILLMLLGIASTVSAQTKATGRLNAWTLSKVESREKDDEILPVAYKMRVSKNDGFDRIVFEFTEKEVPEYTVYYTKSPAGKVKGNAFAYIVFALGFEGKAFSQKFSGEQNLPQVRDIRAVDWSENFFTFAVGLNAKKPFRVQELSNPTRLVVDFKS